MANPKIKQIMKPALMRNSWLLGFLILAFATNAAAQMARSERLRTLSPFGGRYDAFRLVFGDPELLGLNLGTLEDFQSMQQPSEWLVVSLGGTATLRQIIGLPREFLQAGGTLLIADDQKSDYLSWAGMSFEPGPIQVPNGPEAYLQIPTCPIVRHLADDSPLFTGVAELILNNPGHLAGPGAEMHAQAWLPENAYQQNSDRGNKPVVVAAEVGNGRLIAVSDHSVFTNEMIQEGDNLRAALNMGRWLLGNRDPKGVKVLFLEEGIPINEWVDPRFEEGDWPLFDNEVLMRLLNEILREFQAGNGFNLAIRSIQETIGPIGFRKLMLLLVTFVFSIMLCRWLLQNRVRETELSERLPVYEEATLLERRHRELLESRNFKDPAAQFCRHFFLEVVGPVDWANENIQVEQLAPLWTRWKTRQTVQRLWNIANGSVSHRITHNHFLTIARQVSELKDELAAGTLRIQLVTGSKTR